MKPVWSAVVTANRLSKAESRVVRLLASILLCLLVLPLSGWSNGPHGGNGFGTHDWVLYQANRLAAAQGHTWLKWSVAQPMTDDPDTQLHDYYHHVYDVWGSPYGDAPSRVSQLYGETVAELRSGDATAASRSFGLLAHYYADVCNPLHTDQCPEEERVHGGYELTAQTLTDSPEENADWVKSDDIDRTGDVVRKTQDAASFAHQSYRALVDGYLSEGMSSQEVEITRTSLNRAANDLADLIASAASDASRTPLGSTRPLSRPGTSAAVTLTSDAVPATAPAASEAEETATSAGGATATEGSATASDSLGSTGLIFWVVAAGVFAAALFGALHTARAR